MFDRYAYLLVVLVGVVGLSACVAEDAPPEDGKDASEVGTDGTEDEDVPQVLDDLGDQDCHLDVECLPEGDDVLLPQCQVIACVEFKCVFLDREDGLGCDDGDLCTLEDQCVAGVCLGDGLSCEDNNPCTSDGCDPSGGCVNTYNQKPCDDGDHCTVQDHCSQGVCAGQLLQCDDGNPCTDDACSETGGCLWTHNAAVCTDGDACTTGDFCADGDCISGAALDCGSSTPCIQKTCDSTSGCVQTVIDGPCDDGDACTVGDMCLDATCTGIPETCDDGNPCTNDLCDSVTGCAHQNNTGPCEDGDSCTLEDVCQGGACQGGGLDPLCCADGDDDACDDTEPCTTDTCVDGYCDFSPLDCDDGSVCTLDVCDDGDCSHTGVGALTGEATLESPFADEGGLQDWEVTTDNALVTWQVDDSKAQQGTYSAYCGNVPLYSYDLGATDARLARQITVPTTDPHLTYWITQDVADSTCNYDFTTVTINGEALPAEHCGTIVNWTEISLDLTAWAGKTVTLAFRFQTIDAISNKGQGVWLDEIRVSGSDTLSCCAVPDDCPSAEGCLTPVCPEDTASCATPDGAAVCDDGDSCTTDFCGDPGGVCDSTPIEGCCSLDGDCATDDLLSCEVAVCAESACGVDASACCTTDDDCDDELACTADACDEATGNCAHEPIAGCCLSADDCDDANACTEDACADVGGVSQCANTPIDECCVSADDCPVVEKACEAAVCDANTCGVDQSACCTDATSCDDGEACTVGTCNPDDGLCSQETVPDCCVSAADCPAGAAACEVPTCVANECGVDTSACGG